jgi:hypothetical protein
MSYDARERSADQGAPIQLYKFQRGPMSWLYTSANRNVVAESQTYLSAPIRMPDELEQGSEMNRAALRLTMPRSLDVVLPYIGAAPAEVVTLLLRQYHDGDGQLAVLWTGRILSVSFVGELAEMTLEPVYTSLRRMGLRRAYQKGCPYVHYGPQCGVSAAAYKFQATITAINGLTIEASEFVAPPGGRVLPGGYVEWGLAGGLIERRFIFGHNGAAVELDQIPVGLQIGSKVDAYPGCKRITGAGGCADFANLPNYGGMPNIPGKNPFGSEPIY